jgi:hypothetical protein
MGAVLDVKWVHEGKVYVGGYCTAQGESWVLNTIHTRPTMHIFRCYSTVRRNRCRDGYSGMSTSIGIYLRYAEQRPVILDHRDPYPRSCHVGET